MENPVKERTENVPTGKLSFKIDTYNGKDWVDSTQLIEERLSNIVAKLELEGKRLKEEHEERKIYWKEQEEKERILKDLEKRKQKELSDFKDLLTNAHRWKESMVMNEFINSIEADARINNSLTDELLNWISWARKKVEWYNPQIQAQDELLKNEDKEKVMPKSNNLTPSYDYSCSDNNPSFFSRYPYWKK